MLKIFLILLNQIISIHAYNQITIKAKELVGNEIPRFDDDLSFDLFEKAFNRQMSAFKRRPLNGDLTIGGHKYDLSIYKSSLVLFYNESRLIRGCLRRVKNALDEKNCWDEFNTSLKSKFSFYRPVGANSSDALYTGYYSPTFKASKKRNSKYRYGIYKKPSDPNLLKSTRNEINFNNALEGRGLDLFYIDNPYDQYLLHVEGGGVVEVEENGQIKNYFLSYHASNKRTFRWISKYMIEKGYISDTKIESQRQFLVKNPDKWQEIYATCPSFVYFRITKTEPLGQEGIPLTSGRSMAQDFSIYARKGIIGFVDTVIPVKEDGKEFQKPLKRFFIDQDTGGAIKGKARADLYFGMGDWAKYIAHHLESDGKMTFLIKK